uniref:Uncharacterized protein n=1 Tax=Arundo donax TaxID=35708 RepID=A0A0A9GW94_ARUDO
MIVFNTSLVSNQTQVHQLLGLLQMLHRNQNYSIVSRLCFPIAAPLELIKAHLCSRMSTFL